VVLAGGTRRRGACRSGRVAPQWRATTDLLRGPARRQRGWLLSPERARKRCLSVWNECRTAVSTRS
jgi:hypothetical protein